MRILIKHSFLGSECDFPIRSGKITILLNKRWIRCVRSASRRTVVTSFSHSLFLHFGCEPCRCYLPLLFASVFYIFPWLLVFSRTISCAHWSGYSSHIILYTRRSNTKACYNIHCWRVVEHVATAIVVVEQRHGTAPTLLSGGWMPCPFRYIVVGRIVWFGFFKNSAFSSTISKSQMDANVRK